MSNNIHIALLMMVKNEKKRLHITLNSVRNFADSLIIFDTGSTDETVQILKDFSEESGIPLRLMEGDFINFSESRNVSLDFADSFEDVDYLLLLDCNDELRGGEHLRAFAEEQKTSKSTGFLTAQEWWSGQYDKYYNIRFVKAREGWRYRGSVHEWMKDTKSEPDNEPPIIRIPDKTVIYQDRTQDDDKSSKRFVRDKVLLLKDHKEDPTEPRTVFYLAQTCSCLGELEDTFYFYKIRTTLEGFQEEKFQAFLRCGDISEKLNHSWHDSMTWYMKAFEHSQRVEPIIKIADHYRHEKNWILSFTFANLACSLPYPEDSILFVDKNSYEYNRWHILGIVAYYVGKYQEGKAGCEKAIMYGLNSELDMENLKFYKDKIDSETTSSITKKEFIEKEKARLIQENPNITTKQLVSRANALWKLRIK